MGQYGHAFDNFIEQEKDKNVVIEIYVSSELFDQLQNSSEIAQLNENVISKVNLNDKKSKTEIVIMIRDRKTLSSAGGDVGNHGCSIKLVGPKSIVKQGIDIIVPNFKKNGEAPYPGAKVPGEFTGSDKAFVDPNVDVKKQKIARGSGYIDEVNLALKFANEYQKQLNLIFKHPENEQNQFKLLSEIINNCDYISKFSIESINKDKAEAAIAKYTNKKGK